MRLKVCLMLAVLAVSAASAFAATFTLVGPGLSSGLAQDGSALSYQYGGHTYIYNVATGVSADLGASYASFDMVKVGSNYGVGMRILREGTSVYDTVVYVGDVNGAGTTYKDPTSGTNYFYARSMQTDAAGTDILVAGQRVTTTTTGDRWRVINSSFPGSNPPAGVATNLWYAYGVSANSELAGWGRSTFTTSGNRNQAFAGAMNALVPLMHYGGAYNVAGYFSDARAISANSSTVVGETGTSDNAITQACFWNKGAGWSVSTAANLIPFLNGYAKSWAFKVSADGNIIAGYQQKATGATGTDKRTIFLYDKTTNVASNLMDLLTNAGIDMSAWGLMDVTGLSADGRKITGTMLAADDTYWTTGTVSGSYSSFYVDLDASAVPEPGSLLALGTGLVGLFGVIRRRK